MKNITLSLLPLLLLLPLAGQALAHGSIYREPAREITPGHDPTDPEPPPNPPPAPGAPTWEVWWGCNKEEILYPRTNRSGGPADSADPKTRRSILSAFEKALAGELPCPDKARTLLALGALGGSWGGLPKRLKRRIVALMRDDDQQEIVQLSAAVALGLLQSTNAESLAALGETVADREAPVCRRASAALALGLLRVRPRHAGHQLVLRSLRSASGESEAQDLAACAFLAMGLAQDAAFLPDLIGAVRSGKTERDRVLSYAVGALGRIGAARADVPHGEIVDAVLKARSAGGEHSARSAVIACGEIGSRPEIERAVLSRILATLESAAGSGTGATRDLAVISLGRIAAATRRSKVRKTILVRLLAGLETDEAERRAHTALALGLAGRSRWLPAPDRKAVQGGLLESFVRRSGKDASRGALALALGMTGDASAVAALGSVLGNRKEDGKLRGYCALALGLIPGSRAEAMIAPALERDAKGDFLVLTSIAASLAGGRELAPLVLPRLEKRDSSRLTRVLAIRAAGKLGDPGAVKPLIALLMDERADGPCRSSAAIALADLYDRTASLVLPRITRDINYSARVPTLESIFSIL